MASSPFLLLHSKINQVAASLATHHVFGTAACRTSVAHQVPLRREVKAASAQVVSCGVVTKENKWLAMRARTARQSDIGQGPTTASHALLSGVSTGWAKSNLPNVLG